MDEVKKRFFVVVIQNWKQVFYDVHLENLFFV